ncbi:hypothetical protein MKZ17_11585 [Solibacillus sp. FSL R7-0682]|uniref:hypothetical protein n=1 Tax=Solibacillus sp. FSL R7-0682 TaxID=2921690 RepID=UPI0030F75398
MKIDLSSLQSILTSNSNLTSNVFGANTSTTSFENYFLNALSSKQNEQNMNPLYKDLSSFGSSSALSTLLSSNVNNSSLITSYLNSANGNTSYFDEQAMQNTFTSYLQNNFQAKQMDLLASAKEKLNVKATEYKEQIGDNPSEAEKFRLLQMNKNVEQLTNYFKQKNEANTMNQTLLSQLQNSSALSQYLLLNNQSL